MIGTDKPKSNKNKVENSSHMSRRFLFVVATALVGSYGTCRVSALFDNYSGTGSLNSVLPDVNFLRIDLGYFSLWERLNEQTQHDITPTGLYSSRLAEKVHTESQGEEELIAGQFLNACIGSEWYTFPSHFFLPMEIRLRYIEDGFEGMLPQHFPTGINGTSQEPKVPFNDQNREEKRIYTPLYKCHYLVRLVKDEDRTHISNAHNFNQEHFKPLDSTKIIDSAASPMLSRAFSIPRLEFLSRKKNSYQNYTLFHVILSE